jgi:hypothetical protein
VILSQIGTENTRSKAYRGKVQRYADEKKSIWEEVKHGIIFGSQAFVDRIKKEYLSGEPQTDVTERKKIVDDRDLGGIIKAASELLNIEIQRWKGSRRISKSGKFNRDMLVYYLWQSGRFSNSEIGSQIGLTISSISRRAGEFQALLDRDKKVQTTYDKFKSIIKV